MNDETEDAKLLFRQRLEQAAFDVEHALSMYASGFCTLPAETIYDKDALSPLMPTIESCHIYLIGFVPKIEMTEVQQEDGKLRMDFIILGNNYSLDYQMPEGFSLKQKGEYFYLENKMGERRWPDNNYTQTLLSLRSGIVDFDVKYIGQAYGQDGSKHALDRLLKHETLQKIAIRGVPDGYKLTVLLLSVQPNNQLFTVFNPFAKNRDDDGSRVKAGLDKLFNTNEQERIALYEASLIRYFYPEYNKEFKDSFPSTNLKVLRDCYEKDFSAIVAEICIDELPFVLKSEAVGRDAYHIIRHDLHEARERRMFFDVHPGKDHL